MKLGLAKLQKLDQKAQKIRVKGLNGYKKVYKVLHYQKIPFIPKIIQTHSLVNIKTIY